jgi:hypothetical protein
MKVQRKKMAAWQAKPYCIQLWGINNLQNKTQTVSGQISYPWGINNLQNKTQTVSGQISYPNIVRTKKNEVKQTNWSG